MSLQQILLLAIVLAGSMILPAQGGSYVYNFGSVFTGDTPGTTTTPWLTAELTDVAPSQVQITFTASNLSPQESVRGLLLNLDPALNPCLLVFQQIGSVGTFKRPRIRAGENAFRAGEAGRFDLRFQFNGGRGNRRQFGAGDQVTYLITGVPGLSAESFDFTSFTTCDQDPLSALARLNGLAPCNESSLVYPAAGFAPVPEPSVPLLLGLAFAALGARRFPGRPHA